MAKVPALSPLNYNIFLGFGGDEIFVLRQLSQGDDIPKIETQLQIKTSREPEKKSARELFAGVCHKLDLQRLGNQKKMTSTAAKWYGEFAEIQRKNFRTIAASARNEPPSDTGVPEDIIAFYGLDLEVLAEYVDQLPPRLQATLGQLHTGSEPARKIGAAMDIEPEVVNRYFEQIYKSMQLRHIRARKHKRMIVRLAYLRSADKKKMAGKPGVPNSLDST